MDVVGWTVRFEFLEMMLKTDESDTVIYCIYNIIYIIYIYLYALRFVGL